MSVILFVPILCVVRSVCLMTFLYGRYQNMSDMSDSHQYIVQIVDNVSGLLHDEG